MPRVFPAAALALSLVAPLAAQAQPQTPSADQIARALGKPTGPAAPIAGNPLQVTPGMLTGATRGIVPARPATPSTATLASNAAPVAAPSVTNPCPAGSGVCDLYIEFETGSATLTPDAIVVLNNLGTALSSLKDKRFHFRVEGHTDTVGGEQFNLALSAQRADAVTLYLSGHFGIDPSELQPVGMGKDHPLVVTPDQTPEPRNRRVQVINVGT